MEFKLDEKANTLPDAELVTVYKTTLGCKPKHQWYWRTICCYADVPHDSCDLLASELIGPFDSKDDAINDARETHIANKLSNQIRSALQDHHEHTGQSVASIARACGMSQPQLSRFINRRRGLGEQALNAVAAYLGLTIHKPDDRSTQATPRP